MGILTLNSTKPTVKRAFRIKDLQDIWEGLDTALALGTETTPRIISGFDYDEVNGKYLSGVIAYKNKLWLYDSTRFNVKRRKSMFFAPGVIPGMRDLRVLGDGSLLDFSYIRMCYGEDDNPSIIETPIEFEDTSTHNFELWKSRPVAPFGVNTKNIENRAVTEPKISDNAVSTRTIKDGAVGLDKLAPNAAYPSVDRSIWYDSHTINVGPAGLSYGVMLDAVLAVTLGKSAPIRVSGSSGALETLHIYVEPEGLEGELPPVIPVCIDYVENTAGGTLEVKFSTTPNGPRVLCAASLVPGQSLYLTMSKVYDNSALGFTYVPTAAFVVSHF